MKRETKAITIDAEVWEALQEICYEKRTPMVSLASMLLEDAATLLEMGAFPDPDNLSMEGMRGCSAVFFPRCWKVGRRKAKGPA